MPSAGTVVTALSAVVALILIANFFNWMLTLANSGKFVSRLGLTLSACLFVALGSWMLSQRAGVVYTWGGNKATAIAVACVFICAGVLCLWQVLAQARVPQQ